MTLLQLLLGLVTVLVGTTFLYEAATDSQEPKRAQLVVGWAGVFFVGVGVAVIAGWLP